MVSALAVSAGILGGVLPDLLEPATNPNHRAFFHSLLTLAGLALLVAAVRDWPEEFNAVFKSFVAGYFSHGLLDLTTPKGLPIM